MPLPIYPIPAPAPDEYDSFYAGYIARVHGADVRNLLDEQIATLSSASAALTESDALYRYAAGKWSVKEVIGHLTDAERIFAYRVLCISRGDTNSLPGFDENAYVAAAGFDDRPFEELILDLTNARASTLRLLDSIKAEWWERRGVANGSALSVRAGAYVIAGHMAHHIALLGDRYGLTIGRKPQLGGAG